MFNGHLENHVYFIVKRPAINTRASAIVRPEGKYRSRAEKIQEMVATT